jgi:hypothetical protein
MDKEMHILETRVRLKEAELEQGMTPFCKYSDIVCARVYVYTLPMSESPISNSNDATVWVYVS